MSGAGQPGAASSGGAKDSSPQRELWVGSSPNNEPRRGGRLGHRKGVFRFRTWEEFNEWKAAHGPVSTNEC